LRNISSWHFSVNLFFILVPRQHWSATFWSSVGTLCAKIPLKVQLIQDLPQAFEETWGRSIRHWPQNCRKNWAAVMAYICKWHNFSQSTTCFLHNNSQIFRQFSARWLLHLGFHEIFA
jgi:hypothetical protein